MVSNNQGISRRVAVGERLHGTLFAGNKAYPSPSDLLSFLRENARWSLRRAARTDVGAACSSGPCGAAQGDGRRDVGHIGPQDSGSTADKKTNREHMEVMTGTAKYIVRNVISGNDHEEIGLTKSPNLKRRFDRESTQKSPAFSYNALFEYERRLQKSHNFSRPDYGSTARRRHRPLAISKRAQVKDKRPSRTRRTAFR